MPAVSEKTVEKEAANAPEENPRSLLSAVLELWRALPHKWLFGSLFFAWALVFYFYGSPSLGYRDLRTPNLFYWMYYAYTNPGSEDTHGLLIPFVVLGLILWKRQELMDCRKAEWWPGFVGLVFAGVIHILGFAMQQQRVSIIFGSLQFNCHCVGACVRHSDGIPFHSIHLLRAGGIAG